MQRYRPGTFTFRANASLLALLSVLACPGSAAEDDRLLVMLQSSALDGLMASAADHGAQLTHHLPIIGAIGVRATASQLEAIKASGVPISRIIDDLAWTPERESESDDDCTLAAGIELLWQDKTAQWQVFNKGKGPITLTRGSIGWPPSLGDLHSLGIDHRRIDESQVRREAGKVTWDHRPQTTIAAGGSVMFDFVFSTPPTSGWEIQNAVVLEIEQSDSCKAKLARSYPAPDEDSYFAAVSGASLLHSHGVTGAGVTVAVLDSGLWEGHPELAFDTSGSPRIKARYDAIQGREVTQATDESGHGTHMTSVIARSSRVIRKGSHQPSYRGIAPNAGIVAIKAFGKDGEAGFLDIVRGIQWAVDNRERLGIRILNLSFASRPRWPYWDDPVNQALMRAWDAGMFIVAAAGNEGPEPMTVGSPGNLPYLLTVGAITDYWTENDRSDDHIPDFSSRGPTPTGHIKPDVVAPGGHIAGIISPDSAQEEKYPEYMLSTGEFVMTGTSQATALVSGLAALILQLEPQRSNDELKCMFMSSAEPAIDLDGRLAYSPFTQGDGLVSVARALTIGSHDCEQSLLNLAAELAGQDHFEGPALFNEGPTPTLPGQSTLISDKAPAEGPSATRRWGIEAHLERLSAPPAATPIDWLGLYQNEQKLIKSLSQNRRPPQSP